MSITAYSNTYYDDFNVKDANGETASTKNFLRILFKPGYSVQVRELNQLQSILQSQINRLGSSIYKDGSAVLKGNCTFDNNISSIDISTSLSLDLSNTKIISNDVNGTLLTATLLGHITITGGYRLYIRYNKSLQDVNNLNIRTFGSGNAIYSDDIATFNQSPIGTWTKNGYACAAFLDDGIFYTKGSFVWTPQQSVFLDKVARDTLINKLMILGVTEAVVNYSTDETLKDNATGMPNYSAPGADRYTIDLSLAFIDVPSEASPPSTNYIRLMTIKDSQSLDTIKKIYTSLDDVLAKRTYEESGDYTLSPFKITLREFYNDGTNGGRYTVGEMPVGSYAVTDNTNNKKIAAGEKLYSAALDPAVAYIKGYRVELTKVRDLYGEKARTPITGIPTYSSARVGDYVLGTFAAGSHLPNITNLRTEYNIYAASNHYHGSDTLIGTCKIRAVDGYIGSFDSVRLHITEVVVNSGRYLSDAVRIYSSTALVDFTIATPINIIDSAYSTNLFPIPYGTTKVVKEMSYTCNELLVGSGTGPTTFNISSSSHTSGAVFGDISNIICRTSAGVIPTPAGIIYTPTQITIPGVITHALLPIIVTEPEANPRYQKTKTNTSLTSGTQETLLPTAVGVYTRMLAKGDVKSIISVYTEAYSGGYQGKNVTSLCTITDDGQRDTYYTNSSITYAGPVTDTLYIMYTYFAHSSGDYFTVNSYGIDFDYGTHEGGNLYDDIPSYKGVRLSDVYDFRRMRLQVGSGEVTTALDPDSIITSTVDYFMPRIDTVIVDSNGIFGIVKGDSALEPKIPITPNNAISLYTLNIPAYTFSPKDITVNYIDNRRYTMRDIGGIEKRISNIEYYTSLSLLETSAQNASIIDAGGDRYKNGYIVDAFTGNSIGDPTNVGYACSMDMTVGLCRPKFDMRNLRLVKSDTSNVAVHDHIITLKYDEKNLIDQSVASDTLSVNPYDIAVFAGNISLVPSTDNWKDTTTSPDLIVDDTGAYDAVALTEASNPAFGYHWNEWATNWQGITTESTWVDQKKTNWWGHVTSRGFWNTVTTNHQSRTGTLTTLGYTDQTQSLGTRVVDISYIPYIRSRKIYFKADKLKPNTRLYAFFDGINVTAYCNQLTNTPASIDNDNNTAVYKNLLPGESPLSITLPIITTDQFGNVEGEFYIPNTVATKFKCGQRIFKLTDSPINLATDTTTVADTQYIASGIIETSQTTQLSIRSPELVVTDQTQDRGIVVPPVQYSDPLAQTFLIPNVEEGLFATSIDLYFSAKSSTLPVTAYIVLVSNGIPTQQIMPFSTVTIAAANITVDPDNGAIATNFKFSDPVYLLNGTEYAIVVTSNSADYKIWVATVGSFDVKTKTAITKNVYNGVLLMSQNASTWTPEQTKDMKFRLNYASFNTQSADVTFDKHIDGGIIGFSNLPTVGAAGNSYISATAPVVTISPPGTPAVAGTITLDGTSISKTVSIPLTATGSNYTLPPLVTISAPNASGGGTQAKAHATIAAGAITAIIVTDGGSGYNSATINIAPPGVTASATVNINPATNAISSLTITNPGSGYNTLPTVSIPKSTTGVWSITAILDSIDITMFNVSQNSAVVNKTTLSNSLELVGVIYPIIANENYAITTPGGSIVRYESGTAILTSTLTSTSAYLSPVIDIERNSIVCINNIIGLDYTLALAGTPTVYNPLGVYSSLLDTELTSDTGNTSARYITRTVNLNSTSDRVDIYVNVNRPTAGSNIRVYVKYNEGSTWNLYNPDKQIAVSSDPNSFTEIHYTDINSNTQFVSFAVKIVMFSNDKTQVPLLKDFRAIATF